MGWLRQHPKHIIVLVTFGMAIFFVGGYVYNAMTSLPYATLEASWDRLSTNGYRITATRTAFQVSGRNKMIMRLRSALARRAPELFAAKIMTTAWGRNGDSIAFQARLSGNRITHLVFFATSGAITTAKEIRGAILGRRTRPAIEIVEVKDATIVATTPPFGK